MNQDNQYFKYWGKASKPKDKGKEIKDAPTQYHLLVYHCLDVAAVADCLLASEQLNYLEPLAKQLKVKPKWLRKWLVFCIALHDLGKFFRSFQNLNCNDIDYLVPLKSNLKDNIYHDALGLMLWGNEEFISSFEDVLPEDIQDEIYQWLKVVCAHHGKPIQFGIEKPLKNYLVKGEDDIVAVEFIKEIYQLFKIDNSHMLETIDKHNFNNASWLISGITVLSDWLGSNSKFFPYKSEPIPLINYWKDHALPKAKKIFDQPAFKQKKINQFTSITQQFPFIKQLTPLQQYATSVDLFDMPQMFILEDVTGAGKTEAAMVLAHRLLSLGLGKGLYFGLPTMATANAIYNRLKDSYKQLFVEGSKPSLVLAHSARDLSKSFQETLILDEQIEDSSYDNEDQTATSYCNWWFADSRKKALLADIGVGTIDQALLAILPIKHQCLRMLGLRNKILLLDEVHAYDAYTSKLLIALLEMHKQNGGSVIILSATLQQSFRKQLIEIYSDKDKPISQQYPLATHAWNNDFTQTAIKTRDTVKRNVIVKRLASEQQAVEKIITAIKKNQCICWIRNSVADVLEIYKQLKQHPTVNKEKITLFHSRFAMADRQKIEAKVLNIFGKESTATERQGQILIATQVVEQSLDLDFDVMISDLAPVDFKIQRSGRLQRHIRDIHGNPLKEPNAKEQRPKPCMYILMPDPNKIVDNNWLIELLPQTSYVYKDTARLWKTAEQLVELGSISMPDDARKLINAVYDIEINQIPQSLQDSLIDADGDQASKNNLAEYNTLNLNDGYADSIYTHWNEEENISTRLSEVDMYTIILVELDSNDNLQFYAMGKKKSEHILLSQLNVSYACWQKTKKYISATTQQLIETFKKNNYLKEYHNIFPLTKETKDCYSLTKGWDKDWFQ